MFAKRLFALFGAVFVLSLFTINMAFSQTVEPFLDVPEDYEFRGSIEYLHAEQLLFGDEETGEFRHLGNLNRAEFAAVLSRVAEVEPTVEEYSDCFPDVAKQWYAPHVCYAKQIGWVKGYSAGPNAGNYGPGDSLLSIELIEILSRILAWEVTVGGEWYEPAWNYAVARNIVIEGNQSVGEEIVRGEMAENIFRAGVVGSLDLEAYAVSDGDSFIENAGFLEFGGEEVGFLTLGTIDLGESVIADDAVGVKLLTFSAEVSGDESAEINRFVVSVAVDTSTRNLASLYVRDDLTQEILFEVDTKLNDDELWVDDRYVVVLENPMVFLPGETSSYTLLGDFDWEERGNFQLEVVSLGDVFATGAIVAGDFPLEGALLAKDPLITNFSHELGSQDVCALFDAEYNLPYDSRDAAGIDGTKTQPAEPGGTVAPPEEGHVIKPIDQGDRPICAAAAVYSSLRWFEEMFDVDLITDGQDGLDELIEKLHDNVDTASGQDEALEEYVEGLNECLDVSYDTQAGLNVWCSDLKKYHDKGCDIPLSIRCEEIDPATGDVLTGDDANSWGHRVDLTDVTVNPDDNDECSITFANSWSDAANPGVDLDGLGAGRYEEATYNDDDESFDVNTPWGARYNCKLRAAAYICIDADACE